MVSSDIQPDPVVIRAAGGLVWRRDTRGWKLAIVHRPKYEDWSLPKGKLANGETWLTAAIREVREETGSEVTVGRFAGTISYLVKGHAKIVLYWNMLLAGEPQFEPGSEVDRVLWLPRRQAMRRIHHAGEKRILLENPRP